MNMNESDHKLFLARVASLYYDQGKNQQEIADELGISRSSISRYLTEAQQLNIVEIIVHYPWRTSPELERRLVEKFHLKAAAVLVRGEKSYEQMLEGLGFLASQYFGSIIQDGMLVGISWGTALYQMIRVMPVYHLKNIEVIQLVGASGAEHVPTDGPILAQLLSIRVGGYCRYLHAPLMVESETVHETLMQDHNISETLSRAEMCDLALLGIGTTSSELNSLLRAGYIDERDAQKMRTAGAVGDICAQFYNIHGEILNIDFNRRTIGITLEKLQRVRHSVGVAGGSRKAASILGALRGHYINALITDDRAAERILALDR
jgi:deoxyribonucleoside regulator